MNIDSEIFSLIILPILIFLARVVDVSFGTIRIILISRGRKFLAPIFGFCEIMIWLFAISQIMQNLTNITYYLAYACGYAGKFCRCICRRENGYRNGYRNVKQENSFL